MKKIILVLLLLISNVAIRAQYPELFGIGTPPILKKTTTPYKYAMYLTGYHGLLISKTDKLWIKVNTYASQTAVYTNGNITFFNPDKNRYNSIICSRYTTVSDARFKRSIKSMSDSVPTLSDVMSSLLMVADNTLKSHNEKVDGNVEEIKQTFINSLSVSYPNLVHITDDGSYFINYTELLPILVRDLQVLKCKSEELDHRIQILKNEVDEK